MPVTHKMLESRIEDLMSENVRLRAALSDVTSDILAYEKVNNLSPDPGRKYCWDSVARAVAILEQ